jgi:two-component system sensor histidine kinase/response regulator
LKTTSDPQQETILIVDDQEANLRVLAPLLTALGYDVIPASSGAQALDRLKARVPDLVLLDVLMPGMDGLEVCRQMRSDPRLAELPIIFVSAADDTNLIVSALEAGGVDYVTKPFQKAELVSRVRTHLALKQARDRARHLAEDKDELLGILAHDLKNHIAGINLQAELLAEDAISLPGIRKPVEGIRAASSRLLAFVREFLSNQHAERLVLKPQPMDLRGPVREAVERHRPAAAAKQIALRVDEMPDPLPVQADSEALAQVLDNLLSNAIKFSPADSTVTVVVQAGPVEFTSVTVADQGPGFTAEDRERMFRRYGRLSARPTGGEVSTGLGLSIIQRLVQGMHGRITVESTPGAGAEFRIMLPTVRSAT